MTPEYLLDAVGLLDDGLIREAEEYGRPKARWDYRRWAGLAACAALVLALGYGVTHLRMAGQNAGNGMSGEAACKPSASAPAGGAQSVEAAGSQDFSGGANGGSNPAVPDSPGSFPQDNADPGVSGEPSSSSGGEEDFCPAIMVDGVVYWSTGTPVPGEVDESAVRTVTSYTDTQPEEDGQTNFDRSLTTQYAVTDLGLVVQIDNEWVLFDPVPPWEK